MGLCPTLSFLSFYLQIFIWLLVKGDGFLKLKYMVDDIASLLTNFYIYLTDNKPSETKRSIMCLHMKQAIMSTWKCSVDPWNEGYYWDDLWQISMACNHNLYTFELRRDTEYDRQHMRDVVLFIQDYFDRAIKNPKLDYDDDLLVISDTPFSGISISIRDIISLLDIDCM